MSRAALENIQQSESSTQAKDEAEKNLAKEFLVEIEKFHSKSAIVKSLTVPRGEEYLESTLIRFLRARNGNIKKAVDMVNECMAFRKKHDVDNILKKPLAKGVVDHLNQWFYHGILPRYDKFGRPCLALRGGQCAELANAWQKCPEDFENWSYADLEDSFLHYHLIMIEYLTTIIFAEASIAHGKMVNKYVVIDDLQGATVKGMMSLARMIGIFTRQARIDQLLYPELLGGLFFLNAPQIFQKPWSLVKGFIDPATRKKIFMLGGSKSYTPIMEAGFPPESLPTYWGGTDTGHHVSEKDNPKPEVLEKIYNHCLSLAEKSGIKQYPDLRKAPLKMVKIRAKAEECIREDIPGNSTVEYQISVESNDIEYSVTLDQNSSANDDSLTIEHPTRLESGAIRHHGQYTVPSETSEGGSIMLRLSNKHSILKSKTVYYRIMHYPNSSSN